MTFQSGVLHVIEPGFLKLLASCIPHTASRTAEAEGSGELPLALHPSSRNDIIHFTSAKVQELTVQASMGSMC